MIKRMYEETLDKPQMYTLTYCLPLGNQFERLTTVGWRDRERERQTGAKHYFFESTIETTVLAYDKC